MVLSYQDFYDLTEALEKEPLLIPSPDLYPFDAEKMYAAMMEMAAQPLPSGEQSPFTSKLPGSVHSIAFTVVLYVHQMLAHQMNLVADKTWVEYFRMLGMTRIEAEYPIINLVFTRSRQSIEAGLEAIVPIGTVVQNRFDTNFTARTRVEGRMAGAQSTIVIPATLNRIGALNSNTRVGEFNILPRTLPFIESVFNDGTVVSQGRARETLPEMMLRARDLLRVGRRCVTAPDFYAIATDRSHVGAKKANVIPGYLRGSDFSFAGSIVTVVVYPASLQEVARNTFEEMKMADVAVDVLGAEIVPVDGEVAIRVIPSLVGQNNAVFDLAAKAISERINPPYGKWGDPQLAISVATALELVEGFYAVPSVSLKHSVTGEPIESLEPKPWQLFQIQQSLIIKNIP